MLTITTDPLLGVIIGILAVFGLLAVTLVVAAIIVRVQDELRDRGNWIQFVGLVVSLIALVVSISSFATNRADTGKLSERIQALEETKK
jgi:hypothetical protein